MVFSPANVIFAGVGALLSAAKDVRASQDTLIDVFERIEMFFRRLETYTQVPPTTEMMDIIVQIVVEVLSILGIATKEIKQGRMKKFARKLMGRTEMGDALKRLDKLTQEEARMAAAQNLKATHIVDERVKGVVDTVEAIDNKVADVDDRVADVSEQVAGVDDRVASVNEKVGTIDDRVKGIAGDVDEIRRLSSNLTGADLYSSFQGTNYGKALTNGSLHRTPRRTTISHVALITRKLQRGFFKVESIRSGRQLARFFGSTENLARAKVLSVPQSSKILKRCARPEMRRWPISTLIFETQTNKDCAI